MTALAVLIALLASASTGLAQSADTTELHGLLKAAATAVERGEYTPEKRERDSLFTAAESYGRRAVALSPNHATAHFELARALGRRALSLGVRERAKYGVEIHKEALAALQIDPRHAGALHVLGVWNHQVMQLSAIQRLFAKTILGAKVFGKASWEEAVRSLEDAVSIEPNRIIHRLDLARVYGARKRRAEARDQYNWILAAPLADYNDGHHKREAELELSKLK